MTHQEKIEKVRAAVVMAQVDLHEHDCECHHQTKNTTWEALGDSIALLDELAREEDVVSNITSTDCRSYEGITVGLIDSIITACRILAQRELYGYAVTEALNDMRADRDVLKIISNFKDEDL